MTTKELTTGQRQAFEVLQNLYEMNAERRHKAIDESYELEEERKALDELWKMAGLGTPPEFRTTRPQLVMAS